MLTEEQFRETISQYDPDIVELAMIRYRETMEKLQKKKKVKTDRQVGLSSLMSFIKIYFPHYFDKDFGLQQKELIQDIERFVNKGERKPLKLLRALSRGFGKSTLMSLCGVLWLLLKKEWHFVIMISSTLEAAKGFLRKIIEEVEDNEKLVGDFPELSPAIDIKGQTVSWKDTDIVFRGGFRIIAKGFLNAIRGQRHKNYRPSALIIDDPDEEKDVNSESTMIRKYRWLDRAALKLGTAWGIDVMLAYTTISPNCVGEMIFNDAEKYYDWDKKKYRAIEVDPKTKKEYSTWEEGASLSILLKEREADPLTFAKERQNEVIAEVDQKFKGLIRTYTFNPNQNYAGWRLFLAVDLSLGKTESSDFSALVGVGRTPEGKFKEIYSSIERRRPDQIIRDIVSALSMYPFEACGIEANANQEHFLETFKMLLEEHNRKSSQKITIPILPIFNNSDKIKRITATLQPLFSGGWIEIRDDSKILFKQLDNFPYDKKDGPDALEMAVSHLKQSEFNMVSVVTQTEVPEERGRSIDSIMRERRRKLGI